MVDVSSLVKTENRLAQVRAHVAPLLRRLAAKPDCLGLGVLGGGAMGGSRAFVDDLSDIDLTLLIEVPGAELLARLPWPDFVHAVQSILPTWLPNFKFYDPDSGLEINIHQHVWEREMQAHIHWDDEKCEAYAETLEIVHDPMCQLASLVASKTANRQEREFAAAVTLLTYNRNLVSDGVTKCLKRGIPESAVDVIDKTIDKLINILFFICDHWPPHPKWRVALLRDLARTDQLAAAGYELVTQWRHRALEIPVAQAKLLSVLESVEVRCLKRFGGTWPNDIYNHAIAEHFTDRQLRLATTADQLGPKAPFTERMANEAWNRANWSLDHTPG